MNRPAVAFEVVPPVSPDVLPRMDVAAFVGFADAGPVDVPVAIEDLARFRDIFGADPELAFDSQRGDLHRGYLGPTVESFLGNGGRRCWVVRVADDAELAFFDVPGLSRLEDAAARSFDPRAAFGYARSPGVWANGLRAHTTLREIPLLPAPPRGTSPHRTSVLELTTVRGERQVTLVVVQPPGSITAGDTLRVTVSGGDLQLFLVAGEVQPVDRALLVTAREWVLARRIVESTPADAAFRSPALEVVDPGLLDDGPSSPWSTPEPLVDRLTFDLSVWRADQVVGRVDRLAFSPRHPRFWGNLPTDVDLYWRERQPRADGRTEELETLWDEAAGNRGAAGGRSGRRFPIAGPEPSLFATRTWPLYLPHEMSTRTAPDRPTLAQATPNVVSRSGLEEIRSEIFIDDRLSNHGGETLLRSAELLHGEARDRDRKADPRDRADRPRRPHDQPPPPDDRPPECLRGIHALLTVEEATLVAVPDAVHPGWSKSPLKLRLLAAPELTSARVSDADDEVLVEWTPVAEATAYHLQIAVHPDFEAIEATHTTAGEASASGHLQARLPRPATCRTLLHVRVHALRDAEPSPWSNTLTVRQHAGDFLECATLAIEAALRLSVGASPPGQTGSILQWAAGDGAPLPGASFQVESARDPLFLTGATSLTTGERRLPLPETADGPSYWRVRLKAAAGTASGPWSNTTVYEAPSLNRPLLDRVKVANGRVRFDSTLLLSVHRALLRCCHARGDLLALLTLPRSFGHLDVQDHLAALTPDESAILPGVSAAARDGAVHAERPFTLAENVVLSYGALFFPWLAHRLDLRDGLRPPRFIPGDGVAAAQLARTALERGAWIAAANRVLPAAIATEPRLPDAEVDELLGLQVNVLARTAPGFVLLDDQTLSRESDTRPISVRRLLILLKRLALREGAGLVFEPHDVDLQERVLTDFERVLSMLHQRGAFRGTTPEEAFAVVADATVNPPQSIDAGRLVVELRVAPSEPLKFLRVRLVQSGPQQVSVGEG